MINTSIRQFETQLYDLVNGVPLPNEVKRLVIENVLLKLTNAADADIKAEMERANEKSEMEQAGEKEARKELE